MPSFILRLRTTIYKVPNLDVAKAWFAKTFQTEAYYDQAPYVGFNIAGYELGLFLDAAEETSTADNVMSYWGVGDISVAMAHFQSLDASVHEAPMKVGGDIVTASVRDPWGNVIGLIYNPEFALP